MENKNTENLETRIINAARELFIERGYVETNMSDIAARVGINRPVLHYYFRTKERMFHAVFGSIVMPLVPKLHDIIRRSDVPVSERISRVADIYYDVFRQSPTLPLFMLKEINRDPNFMTEKLQEMGFDNYFLSIKQTLLNEMERGTIKRMPIRYLFLTFYSLLTMPFSAKNLCERIMLDEGETYDDFLTKWKPYIVAQVSHLLGEDA